MTIFWLLSMVFGSHRLSSRSRRLFTKNFQFVVVLHFVNHVRVLLLLLLLPAQLATDLLELPVPGFGKLAHLGGHLRSV